jgi:hypothetical protein
MAIEEQVAAYGGPQYQVTQQVMNRFAEAVQQSRVEIVPRVMINGSGADGNAAGSNVMEGLLTLLLSDKLGVPVNGAQRERSEEAEKLREQIRQGMAEKPDGDGAQAEG